MHNFIDKQLGTTNWMLSNWIAIQMNIKSLVANYLIPFYFNIVFEIKLKLMTMEVHSLPKKINFSIKDSSRNVTKSKGDCGFPHIYWRNLNGKLHFLCSDHYFSEPEKISNFRLIWLSNSTKGKGIISKRLLFFVTQERLV